MTNSQARPIKDYCLGIFDGPHATPKESEHGPVFLGIKNLTNDGRLDLVEIRHVSEEEFPRWTRRVTPQEGDVVFTYEATLHRYAVIPEGFRGCLGRRVALVRPDPNQVDSRYLLYYFLSYQWRQVVEGSIISGATVDRIPLEKFPSFPIGLPSLPVQREVASILSTYDELIENNRRRMALLEEAARQLYHEWFVRLRFPGHEHTRIVDGVPDGWEEVSASEILDINPKEKIEKGSAATYVPMSSISESGMTVDGGDFEHRTKYTSIKFRNGDTLFARITPSLENGKTGYVDFLGENEIACGSTEIIVLRGSLVSPFFTYCLARTYNFRENAIKSMIGSSGRQRVQNSCFDKLRLPLPPVVLLDVFDRTAGPCFKQIKNLAAQNHRLRTARDLILPRLMNGEIAV